MSDDRPDRRLLPATQIELGFLELRLARVIVTTATAIKALGQKDGQRLDDAVNMLLVMAEEFERNSDKILRRRIRRGAGE